MSYKTKEEAVQAAIRDAISHPDQTEGFVVRACVCDRRDLHDHPDHAAIMEACSRCEVTIIGAGGHA